MTMNAPHPQSACPRSGDPVSASSQSDGLNAANGHGAVILPGFKDAPGDSQVVFRALLEAMSRPGRICTPDVESGVPTGLSSAMTAVLLTLIDVDAPLWLPPGTSAQVNAFLRFHCSSRILATPGLAAFVAVPASHAVPALADCNPGEPAYPDRSATLIVEVESLEDGAPLRLSGPGIRDTQMLRPRGLPDDFLAQWKANTLRFPLGVDLILTQGRQMCCLPRTCTVEAA